MKLNETRESAHLRSRVTDLSVVPNLVSYNALLACITPLASQNVEFSKEDSTYKPMLIRDVDTLIANFGDPRIDPEKYVDLYAIMRMVNNGGTCYLAKVYSGNGGKYLKTFNKEFKATKNPSDGNTDQGTTDQGTTDQGTTDDGEYIIKTINTSDQVKFPDWKLVKPDGDDGKIWRTVKPVEAQSIHAITGVTLVTVGSEGTPVLAPLEIVTGTPSDEKQVQINPNKFDSTQQITFTFSSNVDLEKNHLLIEVQYYKVSPITIIASSALDSEVEITYKIASLTPSGIKTVCLFVEAKKKDDGFRLGSARVVLTPTLTNGEIISALNSKLGTYIHFELYEDDQQYADCALSSVDGRDQYSIVKILNCGPKGKFFVKKPATDVYEAQTVEIELTDTGASTSAPGGSATFNVDLENYRKALDQYKDKRYSGCILADMTSKVTTGKDNSLKPMSPDELRTLHYYLKGIAAERKDCTVLLSTPEYVKTISAACDFALSQAADSTKWEYGETPTTDYTLQSFYLEMYYPWLKIKCTKLGGTTPVSVNETIAPTAIVLDNILKSYRERGVHYPVAGDQYGQLSDTFSVINNPKTKFDRDQLVRARINPIWDTGKRGIQIYGNETLNAGYTDLNAAHIARTLVYIRNKIDEYTETLKFNINSVILWNRWKSYVSDYILEPLKSENALSDYEVMMGEDTTTREEIANRMLKGKIKLIFYQSAEIFDLDYIVYSSSNVTIADAESQI